MNVFGSKGLLLPRVVENLDNFMIMPALVDERGIVDKIINGVKIFKNAKITPTKNNNFYNGRINI